MRIAAVERTDQPSRSTNTIVPGAAPRPQRSRNGRAPGDCDGAKRKTPRRSWSKTNCTELSHSTQ